MSKERGSLIETGRRAWALVEPRARKRLKLFALYGVLIAVLDTFALILIFALISLLTKQNVGGIAGFVFRVLHLHSGERYRSALVLLLITSALFVARSLLSVLGL